MGRLRYTEAVGPDIITKPHFFEADQEKAQRREIPTTIRRCYDPSDANYHWVEGKLRRKPETTPAAKRAKWR